MPSSLASTISSKISNPTRNDGSLSYGSRTICAVGTSTNVPLMKYTPSATPTAYPVAVEFTDKVVKTVSPIRRVVFP